MKNFEFGTLSKIYNGEGNRINNAEDLMIEFPSSKIELGVTDKVLVKNVDGAIEQVEKIVNKITIKNKRRMI